MGDDLNAFFRGDYMPHGHCYLWQPGILWTNVLSDLLIGLAYFSIPILLVKIVRERKDLRFEWLFFLFAAFITFCGITHVFAVFTIWHGAYGMHGVLKAMTAIASTATAYFMYIKYNDIIIIPSYADYTNVKNQAFKERLRRTELEETRKNEAIFKHAIEFLPTGLLVVDSQLNICVTNNELERVFGYTKNELIGEPLSVLLNVSDSAHHSVLAKNFMSSGAPSQKGISGRVIHGVRKDGTPVAVDVTLSTKELDGKQYSFASVSDVAAQDQSRLASTESYSRLQRAVDGSNDGVWEWNIQTGEVWYSPQTMRMLGRSPKDKPKLEYWYDYLHPDDRAEVEDKLKKHFEKQQKFDVLYRGRTERGTYEWVNSRGKTIFDSEGKPLLMSGILTNVHALKTLKDELNEQTRLLNAVLEKSLCAVYLYDFERDMVTYVNPAFESITGYSAKDMATMGPGEWLDKGFHPNDIEVVKHFVEDANRENSSSEIDVEARILSKNGDVVWCYFRNSIYSLDEKNKPKEILGTFFDITKLKERESRIQHLMEEYSTTFEQAAIGIAHLDSSGIFLKVNQQLEAVLGLTGREILGRHFDSIVADQEASFFEETIGPLLNNSEDRLSTEKLCVTGSGKEIWMHISVALVKAIDGQPKHFIAVLEDITNQKNIEMELAESNKALEQFAYSASHDLQEPLRKLSAFAGLLKQRLDGRLNDNDAIFQLERISSSAKRMSLMIHNLLQLSRYSRTKLDKEKVRLSALLEVVKDDLSAVISRNKTTVSLVSDIDLYVEVNGFQQVLRNLIANAIAYRKVNAPPCIDIAGYPVKNNMVGVSVKDNGHGFDNQFSEQIFEPFKRLVGQDKPGTGMGLAICRQVVKAHGGSIKAISKPVSDNGSGTEFIIELPDS